MLGRDAEWQLVHGLLRRAEQGSGGVLLVDGEPGIGKSLLLSEAAGAAAASGFSLAAGTEEQLGRVIPFFALRRALREPFRELAGAGQQRDRPEGPAWRISQLQAYLQRWSAVAPVLVTLDDLQWASPATLLALRMLPGQLAQYPIAWILARSDTRRADAEFLFGVLERGGATRITLSPLGDDAVTRLITDTFGAPPDESLLGLAAGATGNPLLLTELIGGLREEQAVRVSGGRAVLASARLPARIDRAVLRRLDDLSDRARHLLVMAAVLGRTFRLEDMAEMLGETPAALLPVLEEALAAGLVVADDETFFFRHPLLRRAAAGLTPRPARSALHYQFRRILLDRGEAVAGSLSAAAVAGSADPGPRAGPRSGPRPAAEPAPRQALLSGPAEPLSAREAEVLRWLSSQLSLREIAGRLFVSYYTVKTHTRHIYRKLGVCNRQQAVAWTRADRAGR
jgi:predicted ATPase/DNA-binding CsgD family transcriptional regulator